MLFPRKILRMRKRVIRTAEALSSYYNGTRSRAICNEKTDQPTNQLSCLFVVKLSPAAA